MSEFEDNTAGSGGEDDVLAAEYVLGVLDPDQKAALESRILRDTAFARQIEDWQERLSGMNGAYGEFAPPARLLPAIEARLFSAAPSQTWVNRAWNSLTVWRSFAAASIIGLLALAVLDSGLIGPDPASQAHRYVAALEPHQGGQQVLAVYDGDQGTVRISGFPADLPHDHTFELWFAVGQNPPVSLGLLPREGEIELPLAPQHHAQLSAEADMPTAHFGISLEPLGGSPTGAPTGPVLVVGDLRSL